MAISINRLKDYFPNRHDYPADLNILSKIDSKEYYNAIEASASAYFDSPLIVKKLFYKRLEKTISLIDKKKYLSSLDAGTGIGILIPYLSKISKKVLAVDYTNIINYAKAMVKKKEISNVSFKKLDLTTVKFKKKFDIIICLSVLEHIDDTDKVFDNLYNSLENGGLLIVGYPLESKLIKFIRNIESLFRKNMSKQATSYGYKKTKYFTGHISDWKKIDNSMKKYFKINEKVDLSFFFIKYYALRKAYRK